MSRRSELLSEENVANSPLRRSTRIAAEATVKTIKTRRSSASSENIDTQQKPETKSIRIRRGSGSKDEPEKKSSIVTRRRSSVAEDCQHDTPKLIRSRKTSHNDSSHGKGSNAKSENNKSLSIGVDKLESNGKRTAKTRRQSLDLEQYPVETKRNTRSRGSSINISEEAQPDTPKIINVKKPRSPLEPVVDKVPLVILTPMKKNPEQQCDLNLSVIEELSFTEEKVSEEKIESPICHNDVQQRADSNIKSQEKVTSPKRKSPRFCKDVEASKTFDVTGNLDVENSNLVENDKTEELTVNTAQKIGSPEKKSNKLREAESCSDKANEIINSNSKMQDGKSIDSPKSPLIGVDKLEPNGKRTEKTCRQPLDPEQYPAETKRVTRSRGSSVGISEEAPPQTPKITEVQKPCSPLEPVVDKVPVVILTPVKKNPKQQSDSNIGVIEELSFTEEKISEKIENPICHNVVRHRAHSNIKSQQKVTSPKRTSPRLSDDAKALKALDVTGNMDVENSNIVENEKTEELSVSTVRKIGSPEMISNKLCEAEVCSDKANEIINSNSKMQDGKTIDSPKSCYLNLSNQDSVQEIEVSDKLSIRSESYEDVSSNSNIRTSSGSSEEINVYDSIARDIIPAKNLLPSTIDICENDLGIQIAKDKNEFCVSTVQHDTEDKLNQDSTPSITDKSREESKEYTLNSSTGNNSSDKENICRSDNLATKDKFNIVSQGVQVKRISNVFRPKQIDHSFVEPMEIEAYFILNDSKNEPEDVDETNINTERSVSQSIDDSIDETFNLCLDVTNKLNDKDGHSEEKIDLEEFEVPNKYQESVESIKLKIEENTICTPSEETKLKTDIVKVGNSSDYEFHLETDEEELDVEHVEDEKYVESKNINVSMADNTEDTGTGCKDNIESSSNVINFENCQDSPDESANMSCTKTTHPYTTNIQVKEGKLFKPDRKSSSDIITEQIVSEGDSLVQAIASCPKANQDAPNEKFKVDADKMSNTELENKEEVMKKSEMDTERREGIDHSDSKSILKIRENIPVEEKSIHITNVGDQNNKQIIESIEGSNKTCAESKPEDVNIEIKNSEMTAEVISSECLKYSDKNNTETSTISEIGVVDSQMHDIPTDFKCFKENFDSGDIAIKFKNNMESNIIKNRYSNTEVDIADGSLSISRATTPESYVNNLTNVCDSPLQEENKKDNLDSNIESIKADGKVSLNHRNGECLAFNVVETTEVTSEDQNMEQDAKQRGIEGTNSEFNVFLNKGKELNSEIVDSNKLAKKTNRFKQNSDDEYIEIADVSKSKLDAFLDRRLEGIYKESESDDVEDTYERNEFIDNMAEEGEEDTPSEDSNQIIDEGESIHSEESEMDTDEDYHDNDSFICDEEELELLSGEEYDLGQEIVKRKKRSRIIDVEHCNDDVIFVGKVRTEDPKVEKMPIINVADSGCNIKGETSVKEKKMQHFTEAPTFSKAHTRKSSITVHENISVTSSTDEILSHRINSLVESFCSKIHKGDISLNLSLEYDGESKIEDTALNKNSTDTKPVYLDDNVIAEPLRKKPKLNSDLTDTNQRPNSYNRNVIRKRKKRNHHLETSPKKIKTKDLRGETFSLMNQLITDVKNRPLRTVKPSTSKVDMNNSWLVDIVEMTPSTSVVSEEEIDRFKRKKIHPKDFRQQMLYDSSRVKRMETKTLLKKRGV